MLARLDRDVVRVSSLHLEPEAATTSHPGPSHEATATTIQQRCEGALLGLGSGDRNGGPVRMGLMCSQSVLDLGKANADEAFRRYYEWWDPDVPSEDKAFDTGATFSSVCKAVKRFGELSLGMRLWIGI